MSETGKRVQARLRGASNDELYSTGQKFAQANTNKERGETAGAAGGGAAGLYFGGAGGAAVGAWLGGKGGGAIGGWFDNPQCVKGEDPNDPECDGEQVIVGAKICAPGEDAKKTGCIPNNPGSAHRSAPATGAFPSRAAETEVSREEARTTREAQARFEREEAAAKEGGGGVAFVVVGSLMLAAGGGAVWYLTKKSKKRRR